MAIDNYSGENIIDFMRFIQNFIISFVCLLFLSSCVTKDQDMGRLSTLKIICLGDSITYGYKLADPAHQSYPAQLSKLGHGRWHVLNLGVNGATATNKGDIPITAQKVYQRVIHSRPDVVVVMLGTNSTKNKNWQFLDEFVDDYTALVRKIQDTPSSPHVIICSTPPIFADLPNGINREREEEINILVKKVATITKADFLDIFTLMSQESTLFIDGVHPNSLGAHEIATLVFNKITSLEGK